MVYSEAALRAYIGACRSLFRSNAEFHELFPDLTALEQQVPGRKENLEEYWNPQLQRLAAQGTDGMLCVFDPQFPAVPPKVRRGNRPCLLFYRGNIELLQAPCRVAVIGTTRPDPSVVPREEAAVNALVKGGAVIVSGLALGCDSIAHRACLAGGGKTIAVLPSSLGHILPAANRPLAEEIVKNGGLLLTEYPAETADRYSLSGRYIARDRLEAYFSHAVLLAASNRKSDGTCGSRHAMEKAERHGIRRYAIYQPELDEDRLCMGLNRDYVEQKRAKAFIEADAAVICGTGEDPADQQSLF